MAQGAAAVLLGLDPFGREVLERFQQGAARGVSELALLSPQSVQELPDQLVPALEALLRAGRAAEDRREPRLNVFMFGDLLHGPPSALAAAVAACTKVVTERFGVIFRKDAPEAQRTATLHLLALAPPLSGAAGVEAVERLGMVLRQRHRQGSYPLLARVWLVSTHTRAGVLTPEEVVNTCAGFVQAATDPDLQAEDDLRQRLAHPLPGEGPVGFLALASLDLPEARTLRYAAWRAAWEGLSLICARLDRPPGELAATESPLEALRGEGWLTPLAEGHAAQRVRKAAASLSGADNHLPAEITVGPLDDAESLSATYAVLLAPQVTAPPTRGAHASLDDALGAARQAEAAAAQEVRGTLRALLDGALGSDTGLRRLPEVEQGLRHWRARLADQLKDDQALIARAEAPPAVDESDREVVERALSGLPTRGALVRVALAATLGLSLPLGMLFSAAQAPSAPPPGLTLSAPTLAAPTTAGAAPLTLAEVGPWLIAAAVAALAAAGIAYWAGRSARAEAAEALTARRDTLADRAARGGGGATGEEADRLLRLRTLRARRDALTAAEELLTRLQAIRHAVLGSRDAARQRLVELGVSPQPDPLADDLRALCGEPTLLHLPLLEPRPLARWISRGRLAVEPEVWADRLLRDTWPVAGLGEDAPAADLDQLYALGEAQVAPLRDRSLFEDPEAAEAAAEAVRRFAQRAGSALERPIEPLDPHGDPAAGLRAGALLVIAPLRGRGVLEEPVRRSPWATQLLWTQGGAPRVQILRTWEGHTLAELRRALGLPAEEVAP